MLLIYTFCLIHISAVHQPISISKRISALAVGARISNTYFSSHIILNLPFFAKDAFGARISA